MRAHARIPDFVLCVNENEVVSNCERVRAFGCGRAAQTEGPFGGGVRSQ